MSTAEFADLYSWYSWPNVVLPVMGGLLIDSVFGLRLGTVIFSALCCAGQLLLGLGASKVKHQFSAFAEFNSHIVKPFLRVSLNYFEGLFLDDEVVPLRVWPGRAEP